MRILARFPSALSPLLVIIPFLLLQWVPPKPFVGLCVGMSLIWFYAAGIVKQRGNSETEYKWVGWHWLVLAGAVRYLDSPEAPIEAWFWKYFVIIGIMLPTGYALAVWLAKWIIRKANEDQSKHGH